MPVKVENLFTLSEACSRNRILKTIVNILDEVIKCFIGNPDLLSNENSFQKKEGEFIEYQYIHPLLKRYKKTDKTFPVESIVIDRYNREHEGSIESATIHIGSDADELARSMNVMAMTVGKDIYFRNGTYKPESEEGRALLAHELTHVQQYREKRVRKSEREELESEAEKEEIKEIYEADPYILIQIKNRKYRIRESEYRKVVKQTSKAVKEWVEGQKGKLTEEKYLGLLYRYEKWMKGKK